MKYKGNILVAPLNWGLGHATRCIPLIRLLLKNNYQVFISSDGDALELLRKEFPQLQCIELPSYDISYPKNEKLIRLKLLYKTPTIIKSIIEEKKRTEFLVKKYRLTAIISDNRYGVRHPEIPSIIMSHQINVLSGSTSLISSELNKFLINKFDHCWVPDYLGKTNLSGYLSNADLKIPKDYIGILSRLKKRKLKSEIDILIILSGPSPHREILELKMLRVFKNQKKKIVLIKGKVEDQIQHEIDEGVEVYNYLTSQKLEEFINMSRIIICRSGYSSIMDLACLSKKAFFIPTPGQFEQLYLAKRMKDLNIAPYCHQDSFTIKHLEELTGYTGFINDPSTINLESIFSLLEGK